MSCEEQRAGQLRFSAANVAPRVQDAAEDMIATEIRSADSPGQHQPG
jgi:hypothetical protein